AICTPNYPSNFHADGVNDRFISQSQLAAIKDRPRPP
nr:E3 ubiquitin-protein ligase UPL6-like isoform X3 [Tanacetum cinerariifolium]